jgi:hypothetical protein
MRPDGVIVQDRISAPTFFPYCPGTLDLNFSGSEKVSSLCGLTFWRFGVQPFRCRNANLFAPCLILRFSREMISAFNAASKLCADIRTTLRSCGFQPPAFAQLARGEPPLHPPAPQAASGNSAGFHAFRLAPPRRASIIGRCAHDE